MEERLFIAKNLPKAVRDTIKFFEKETTNGMTESEKKAFDLGVTNCIYALETFVLDEFPVVCLDVPNDEEMDIDELFEQFDKEL